jgi:hypothetical protein
MGPSGNHVSQGAGTQVPIGGEVTGLPHHRGDRETLQKVKSFPLEELKASSPTHLFPGLLQGVWERVSHTFIG